MWRGDASASDVDPLDQLTRGQLHRLGEDEDGAQHRLTLPALQEADGVRVNVGGVRQAFLG